VAATQDRIIVSADTDFGTLLTLRQQPKPSVILYRRRTERRPDKQVALLLVNLERIRGPLKMGSIVVFDEHRIRFRSLASDS
jgi:predicted nuclease of predicted toxin-antitoxin system